MWTNIGEDPFQDRGGQHCRGIEARGSGCSKSGRRIMSVNLSFGAVVLQLRSGTYMLEKSHDVEERQLVAIGREASKLA